MRTADEALKTGYHIAGFVSYEAGYALEPAALRPGTVSSDAPLAWFGVFDDPVTLTTSELNYAFAGSGSFRLSLNDRSTTRDDYIAAIRKLHQEIREGEVYQVNLTFDLRGRLEGSPEALFQAGRKAQPTEFAALIRTGYMDVLSFSPELFFEINVEHGSRKITTRPMKGTAPRESDPWHDATVGRDLASDGKNRAENLMIVDLLRNDLNRIAKPGSVAVPRLFDTESYPTVWQMTSTVEASIRDEATLGDVMRALFPCGSVTGAPKVRAMHLIAELESRPRGIYCGAIGYAAPDGHAAFNVPIRTLEVSQDGRARLGVGSGVVSDSDPDSEFAECLLKGLFLTQLSEA